MAEYEEPPSEKKWLQSYGLRFEEDLTLVCVRLDIIFVGSGDCGKTQLIQSIFHPSVQLYIPSDNFDRYLINLQNTIMLRVFDVRNPQFLQTETFIEKTAFIFCYDVDNPESFTDLETRWIPPLLERQLPRVVSFPVGIEIEPNSDSVSDAGMERHNRRRVLFESARRLSREHHGGFPLQCRLSDRDSMLNVFQTALDTFFPRTSYN